MSHTTALRVPQVPRSAPARLARARARRAQERRRSRRAAVLGAVVTGVLVAAIVVSAALPLLGSGPSAPAATAVVRVAPGETLWDLASAVAGPEDSVPVVVSHIRELNDLDSSEVAAGSLLVIPMSDDGSELAAR